MIKYLLDIIIASITFILLFPLYFFQIDYKVGRSLNLPVLLRQVPSILDDKIFKITISLKIEIYIAIRKPNLTAEKGYVLDIIKMHKIAQVAPMN